MLGSGIVRNLIIDNPVVWREARLRFWRHWQPSAKIALAVSVIGGAAILALWTRGPFAAAAAQDRQVIAVAYGVLLAISATLIGARSVAGEREVRTWEQLLITRLRPVHLIVGKIVGVIWQSLAGVLVTAPVLFIWTLHVDRSLSNPSWYGQPPVNPVELLFAPVASGGYGGPTAGLIWLFTAGLWWMIQGATIGVFASLRYRSTVTSAIVALVLLSVAVFLDYSFLYAGGDQAGTVLPGDVLMLAVISLGALWLWPCVTMFIMIALGAYEFREFDRWIQAGQVPAGK
jgi:ABC-type Na+ efflux pump permease subunit